MTYSNKSYLLLCETLRSSREAKGKNTLKHHYINENNLLYFAISGSCKRIDFHCLSDLELDILEKVIHLNIDLLHNEISIKDRKIKCRDYVISILSNKTEGNQSLNAGSILC
jgi:hypothetical protein